MQAPKVTALGPIEAWSDNETDGDAISLYTTKAAAAGSVAWAVLTHSQGLGPDIARMIGPLSARRPLPKGMDSEDVYGFLWELVEAAAEIGYVMAQIETGGFDRQWPGARLRTSDLARAMSLVRSFAPGHGSANPLVSIWPMT